ncbi:DUF2878 domain-containing protein [Shewanella sp. Isolate11]|uniref:DUF2878 domain-containing protein n=1 Tax=Shewanella sp. Isolate11 TaxID=2908530 RepID=UPI001EFC6953|nr:DUF2878 domain-containing protein [Shewanella sp. Isolate11]MCG9697078.1 DUF2878 domain-containing protein [Shewanella sp. Isolate11]
MKRFWIINLLLFQLCWFSAALLPSYAEVLLVGLLAVHFLLSPSPRRDCKVLLLVPIGLLVDKLQFEFNVAGETDVFFPLWLLLLWCMFIISFNHSLNWLTRCNMAIVSILGALGGASSYWAGVSLARLTTHLSDIQLLMSLLLIWAVLMPLLVMSYRQLMPIKIDSK